MTMILKVMASGLPTDPEGNDAGAYSLYADIRSVSFYQQPDGSAWARCYVLEPIKTAASPAGGFCENEVNISLRGPAYVMNEGGKTISRYTPDEHAAAADQSNQKGRADDGESALRSLPYAIAAGIRRAARHANEGDIIAAMDRQRVAVDA